MGRKSSRSQAKETRVWKVGGASREPLMCRAVLGCKQARMQMQTCRARESARMASLLFVIYLFLDFFFFFQISQRAARWSVCVFALAGGLMAAAAVALRAPAKEQRTRGIKKRNS